MKCPKCQYLTFDSGGRCRNCGYDFYLLEDVIAGPPVELRLANTGGGVDQTPAIKYLVDRVHELSGGNMRIEVMDEWADFQPDA